MSKFLVFILLAFLPVCILAGKEESFQKVLTRNFSVPDSSRLIVKNPAGTATVLCEDRTDIEIRYRLYADCGDFNKSREMVAKMAVRIAVKKGDLVVEIELPLQSIDKLKTPFLKSTASGKAEWKDFEVNYSTRKGTGIFAEVEIFVPSGVDIEYEGLVGKLDMTGFSDEAKIELGFGEIDLFQTSGTHDILIGSGQVSLDEISGSIGFESGSGDICGTSGDLDILEITTGSGDIELSFDNCSKGIIQSASGDIEIEIKELFDGELSINTASGDIDVKTSGKFASETYTTVSGDISHPDIENDSHKSEIENPEGSGILRTVTVSGNTSIDF